LASSFYEPESISGLMNETGGSAQKPAT